MNKWFVTVTGFLHGFTDPTVHLSKVIELKKDETPIDWFLSKPRCYCRSDFIPTAFIELGRNQMKYIVAYVNACSESAKKLAAALGVRAIRADLLDRVPNDTTVFNYGYGDLYLFERVINPWYSVVRCTNKITTLTLLKNAGIPCLQFCTDKRKIPKSWEWIVVRTTVSGDNGKGIEYVERGNKIPSAPLYTEWYEHQYEYRIVVFKGKVVARYYKHLYEDGYWWFEEQPKKGLKRVSEACIQGALALGIDYVGFDVLYNSDEDFKICEANSGPIITDKVIKAIKKELK